MPGFQYLQFLLVFLIIPTTILLLLNKRQKKDSFHNSTSFKPVLIVIALAVIYTTPWDNYMIQKGVWSYGKDVFTLSIFYAPLEEYMFFVLQPLLTGIFFYSFLSGKNLKEAKLNIKKGLIGLVSGASVSVLGLLFLRTDPTFYTGSILLWAGPILAVQWVGWPILAQNYRTLLKGVLIPTAYLSFADMYAIHQGIWSISGEFTTGLHIFNLPVEEALFFLITNIFIVQTLILYQFCTESDEISFSRILGGVGEWRN